MAPIVFGALTSGLTISTLDPSFDKNGIKVIYSTTRPQIMFCDGDNYDTVKDALQECGLSATKIFTVKNHLEGVPNILEFFEEDCNIQDFQ